MGAKVVFDGLYDARRFPISTNGDFLAELPKSLTVRWSDATDAEWVLMLLDSTMQNPQDQFMGFISMSNGADGTMMSMPVASGIEDIGLDSLKPAADEFISTATIADNATSFTLSLAQLQELARMDNTIKSIKTSSATGIPTRESIMWHHRHSHWTPVETHWWSIAMSIRHCLFNPNV